ncbi:MAG: hypothetical protein WC965_01650 [Thiohalomonadaceae bacterium]
MSERKVNVSASTVTIGEEEYYVVEFHPEGTKAVSDEETIMGSTAVASGDESEKALMLAVKMYMEFPEIERVFCINRPGKTVVSYPEDTDVDEDKLRNYLLSIVSEKEPQQ